MMARPRKPVPEWAAKGREMRANGRTWGQIALRLSTNTSTIRYWCCDQYRAVKQCKARRQRYALAAEERQARRRESKARSRAKKAAETGMPYTKWESIRRHCRELAAQQNRPVEELYREFGVER